MTTVAISEATGIPVRDILRLAQGEGLKALGRGIEESGQIRVPLRMWVQEYNAGTTKDDIPERVPVFLPRGLVELYRRLLEVHCPLTGGADAYIEDLVTSTLADAVKNAPDDFAEGVIADVIGNFNFGDDEDAEAIEAAMIAEAKQWQCVDGIFSRREAAPA